MKRSIFVFILSLLHVLFVSAQDVQKSIELVINDNSPVELKFNFCMLSFSAHQTSESYIILDIDVLNNSQNHILLFGKPFTEKGLKKHKIRFDKKKYGTANRSIALCEGLAGSEILSIMPSGNRTITIDSISGNSKRCEFPLYFTKTKKKKYYIVSRAKIVVNVQFKDDKSASEYENIEKQCMNLINEIKNVSICPKKNHPVSIDKQKEPYNEKILDLKDVISDIKSSHGWKERDEEYQKYKLLIAQLDNVKFVTKYCGQCGEQQPSHKCSYCEMTPRDVLTSLQRTYQLLDNGELNKKDAITKVELIYRAWNGGCPKLKQKRDSDTSNRTKIERYYESIINY